MLAHVLQAVSKAGQTLPSAQRPPDGPYKKSKTGSARTCPPAAAQVRVLLSGGVGVGVGVYTVLISTMSSHSGQGARACVWVYMPRASMRKLLHTHPGAALVLGLWHCACAANAAVRLWRAGLPCTTEAWALAHQAACLRFCCASPRGRRYACAPLGRTHAVGSQVLQRRTSHTHD